MSRKLSESGYARTTIFGKICVLAVVVGTVGRFALPFVGATIKVVMGLFVLGGVMGMLISVPVLIWGKVVGTEKKGSSFAKSVNTQQSAESGEAIFPWAEHGKSFSEMTEEEKDWFWTNEDLEFDDGMGEFGDESDDDWF